MFIRVKEDLLGDDIAGYSWLADLMGMWDMTEDGRPLREGVEYEQGK